MKGSSPAICCGLKLASAVSLGRTKPGATMAIATQHATPQPRTLARPGALRENFPAEMQLRRSVSLLHNTGQVAVGEPRPVEGLAHLLGLVGAEVVHHHERVRPLAQRRDQDLLGEGEE